MKPAEGRRRDGGLSATRRRQDGGKTADCRRMVRRTDYISSLELVYKGLRPPEFKQISLEHFLSFKLWTLTPDPLFPVVLSLDSQPLTTSPLFLVLVSKYQYLTIMNDSGMRFKEIEGFLKTPMTYESTYQRCWDTDFLQRSYRYYVLFS